MLVKLKTPVPKRDAKLHLGSRAHSSIRGFGRSSACFWLVESAEIILQDNRRLKVDYLPKAETTALGTELMNNGSY